jgi:peroxiredoxin/predicted 2-oxoglutarate/Fe(II)-dependent dioxygenase YbiX
MPDADPKQSRYVALTKGDPAPWFKQRSTTNPRYSFDTAAGRYIVLCFFATAADDAGRAAIAAALARRDLFDDNRASFFGVSIDPADERERRVREAIPGLRFFLDFDGIVSRLYGALPVDAKAAAPAQARRFWMLLDPTLRIVDVVPFARDGSDRAALFAMLERLPPPERFRGVEVQAPVLLLPDVFEPAFCRKLIGLYEAHGGAESGFMREVDGKTRLVHDHAHKRRRDYIIEDRAVMGECQERVRRRIVPEILKAHQFKVTRMERYIVSCYSAEDGGHFRAHRDNTTKGTAHRRFAVTINLNAEFEGGELSFPEYGPRSFKPPPGGAVVFSCSLLHAASKVTAGVRYAFLPFLYDDAAAKVREANNAFLDEGVGAYKPGKMTRPRP